MSKETGFLGGGAGWLQSRHGKTLHWCAVKKLTDGRYVGRALCGCKTSKHGWKIESAVSAKCSECEWRLNMVVNALPPPNETTHVLSEGT